MDLKEKLQARKLAVLAKLSQRGLSPMDGWSEILDALESTVCSSHCLAIVKMLRQEARNCGACGGTGWIWRVKPYSEEKDFCPECAWIVRNQ